MEVVEEEEVRNLSPRAAANKAAADKAAADKAAFSASQELAEERDYGDMPGLMGKYYSDLDLFRFFDLSFLRCLANHKFMTKILHLSDFIKSDADYKRLLSRIFPRGEEPAHTYGEDQLPTYDPAAGRVTATPRKFLAYLNKLRDEPRRKGRGVNAEEFRETSRRGTRATRGGVSNPPPPRTRTRTRTHSDFIGVYITFGRRMASFFNIDTSQTILLGVYGNPDMEPRQYFLELSPDYSKGKIKQVSVYSDLVSHAVPVGGQLTNLLDVISSNSPHVLTRQNAKTRYRPLKDTSIASLSMILTDMQGKDIEFERESDMTTLELHIKPVET